MVRMMGHSACRKLLNSLLDNPLPKKTKVRKVEHHAALSHMEIAAFMAELQQVRGVAARALEFLILMACRVGEVIDATWGELDRDARAWVRSAERMKAPQPHRSRCRTLPWPSSIGCLCFGAVMISCSPDLESADLFPRRQSDW